MGVGPGGGAGGLAGVGGASGMGGSANGGVGGAGGPAGAAGSTSKADAGAADARDNTVDASNDAGPPDDFCPVIPVIGDGGLARPPFAAPPVGCGTEMPGRRTAPTAARRPVCPVTKPTDTAVAPNCPAANPNDNLPDDGALQACLDRGGLTALPTGTPGFILATGLIITNNGTTLRGADPAAPARIIAAPTLHATMILADTIHDVVVRYLDLDGNRPARTAFLADCHGYRLFASGLVVRYSHHFALLDNHIARTLCGAALEVDGSDFEIARNFLDTSGHGLEAKDAPEPWGDGITLHTCANGQVHDNLVLDATDVGIVSGGGACDIEHNEIVNDKQHVFAGIALHDFTLTGADHTGSVVAYNTVTARNGMTSFGISLGIHPWHAWPLNGMPAPYNTGATVACNQVSGAAFNMEVDGFTGITLRDNQIGATGGTPRCNGPSTPYVAYTPHVRTSTLQPGWVERQFDGCIP